MSDQRTPYVETEALLAIMDGDREHAEDLLRDLYRSELETFDRQLTFLHDLVRNRLARVRRLT